MALQKPDVPSSLDAQIGFIDKDYRVEYEFATPTGNLRKAALVVGAKDITAAKEAAATRLKDNGIKIFRVQKITEY